MNWMPSVLYLFVQMKAASIHTRRFLGTVWIWGSVKASTGLMTGSLLNDSSKVWRKEKKKRKKNRLFGEQSLVCWRWQWSVSQTEIKVPHCKLRQQWTHTFPWFRCWKHPGLNWWYIRLILGAFPSCLNSNVEQMEGIKRTFLKMPG